MHPRAAHYRLRCTGLPRRRHERRLGALSPGSVHVRQLNLQAVDDEAVWHHAAESGLAIVTKDDDFRQRGFVRGAYVAPARARDTRLCA